MKAIRIHEDGGPEVLRYEDVPDPVPRDDEVLVELRAASLNHLDVWIRKGLPSVPEAAHPRRGRSRRDRRHRQSGRDQPGDHEGRQDAHRRRDDGRHPRRADRCRSRLRPPHSRRALVRGSGGVSARVPDGLSDARHPRATAGGGMGPDLGHRRRRCDGRTRDREGARRAGRRHLVERREARAGPRARRRPRRSTTRPETSWRPSRRRPAAART